MENLEYIVFSLSLIGAYSELIYKNYILNHGYKNPRKFYFNDIFDFKIMAWVTLESVNALYKIQRSKSL